MAQVFVSAGHGGFEDGVLDPGYVLPDTTEAAEMKWLRDMVLAELRSQGYTAVTLPDELSAAQTLSWINARCGPRDVAIELHTGAFPDVAQRGSAVFYVAGNEARRTQAELVLIQLRQAIPQLPSRGVRPDTEFTTGSAAFTRQLNCPSLLMEVIVITNESDLALLQNQRRDFAIGIANGLKEWSKLVSTQTNPNDYPTIAINVNGQPYPDSGFLINERSFVPIEVTGPLGLNPSQLTDVERVTYGNQVYIRAADLTRHGVEVSWQDSTRTVFLKSALPVFPTVAVNVNGEPYPDPGIIVNDSSFVPIEVASFLGLIPSDLVNVSQINYRNRVYIRAADLVDLNIQVEWQASTRTVFLRSEFVLPLCPGRIDLIMGRGATTEGHLLAFLTTLNPDAASPFRDLPRLYREEASIEGVNYDIAFSQMLVETQELTDQQVLAQNNFGGLGSATGEPIGASFPSARVGVRAQIQHLKAYGSVDPLVLQLVDPRFDFVQRGIAPLVHMLSGRWNADPDYGDKIMRYLRQLYESV
jgi:hypothetical protein